MSVLDGFLPEYAEGQRWLRFAPPGGAARADVRLFMRGPLLDGAEGRAGLSRDRLVPLLGKRLPLIAPRQVHGTEILDVSADCASEDCVLPFQAEADGILLDSPEREASLRFADCAPVVVLPSESKRPWALLMHSGYKGTVRNIVRAGLEKVRGRYGEKELFSSFAWIGPCIGGENYPRSREEWTERGLAAFHARNVRAGGEKFYFDIAGELREQLMEGGIAGNRIFPSGVDTFARRDLCYSYRGGDREDRMFLWARSAQTLEQTTGK
jgi:copper oxidase (laccase) domain-containing protein